MSSPIQEEGMKKDGGPAFPHTFDMVYGGNTRGGMSLRAYFAGKALQGLLANPVTRPGNVADTVVAAAVRCADALIAELERE